MSTRRIFASMQKKPWKIIAHIPGLDGNARLEYFIVREADRVSAIATLLSGGGQSHAISCSDCICESLQTAVSS
jgi:hypothetical protein